MTILALDLASHTTGFAVFDGKRLKNSGIIKGKNKDINKRLIEIKHQLVELISTYEPDYVVVEEMQPFIKPNLFNTTRILEKLHGVLLSVVDDYDIELLRVPINKWRQDIGIQANQKRVLLKQIAIARANKSYHLNVSGDDEAEAILIGEWFVNYGKNYFKIVLTK